MTDTANAPEQGNMPDTIMAWPDFDGCVTGSWSANQYSDERARKYVLATLDGGQIEEPTEPGSFVGDIWFGDQIKRTRGTHRWDGAAWQSLPTETEVLIELLAKERAKIARLTEALDEKQDGGKDFWMNWAKKRLEGNRAMFLRDAKLALAGDMRALRNRVELMEAEPVPLVLSAALQENADG